MNEHRYPGDTRPEIASNVTVVHAPRPFRLEIDHYRDRRWLGTTFTRRGYGITYLATTIYTDAETGAVLAVRAAPPSR